MAPSVDPTAVNFYIKKDFGGEAYPYKVGDDVALPSGLNDKFLSVNVGIAAKVLAWRDYGKKGPHREWTGANPDISDIEGLSCFMVVEGDTHVIAFLFKDATGGADRQYSLEVKAKDVGDVTMYSNDGDQYHVVGLMPSGGQPVTTAIYVRDENPGVYIANGSVYFEWNSETNRKYSGIRPRQRLFGGSHQG